MVVKIGGKEAEDKNQGYAAYYDAVVASLAAVGEYPELDSEEFKAYVDKIKRQILKFIGLNKKYTHINVGYVEEKASCVVHIIDIRIGLSILGRDVDSINLMGKTIAELEEIRRGIVRQVRKMQADR